MSSYKQVGWLAASFLLLWTNCGADTVNLPLTDDAFINGNKPDVQTGTWANIVVHGYGPKYGLVRFDSSSINSLHVDNATLELYLNSIAASGDISVHLITSSWNEATVTWNNQPSSEAVAAAIVSVTTSDAGSIITIDVTSAVQRRASENWPDAGFLIVTSDTIKAKFDAKEMAGGTAATLKVLVGSKQEDFNTAFGEFALLNNSSGRFNTAVGYYAMEQNTSGIQNTAFGFNALRNNTSGINNHAYGYYSLEENTIGSGNVAIGTGTLRYNIDGGANTAVGNSALQENTIGENNTALGSQALQANNGTGNTAIGRGALAQNRTGSRNTAVGESALPNNRTENDNIAVGWRAGELLSGGSFNIHIGNRGITGESHTIRIGSVQSRTFVAGIFGATTDLADGVMVIADSNGQLGTISSSRRYKKDIKDMGSVSERLLHLRPVTFRYKEAYANGEQPLDYGLIAEEVAEVFPELVVYNDDNEPEAVKYRLLSTLLVNELQRQETRLAEQETRLAALVEMVEELQDQAGTVGRMPD